MPEKQQSIKSLDELETGDILSSPIGGACIVHAIGEVPEHEKEIAVYLLVSPLLKDEKIVYQRICFKESEIADAEFKKSERKKYVGWKYKTGKDIVETVK